MTTYLKPHSMQLPVSSTNHTDKSCQGSDAPSEDLVMATITSEVILLETRLKPYLGSTN